MRKGFWLMMISVLAPVFANAGDINIPAQPLETSLQELSRLSGVPLTAPANLVKGHDAPALHGMVSIEGALDTLLASSGLTYHVLNTGAIEIAEPMDEVEVTGKYEKLSAMRKEYELLEERFYAEYNKLNSNHDFDIKCSTDSAVFIKLRRCQPVFIDKAYRDATWGAGGSSGFGGADALTGYAQPAVWVWVQAKLPAYRQNMRDQIRKNPRLLELLMKRNAAAERYQVVREKKFEGGTLFVWD